MAQIKKEVKNRIIERLRYEQENMRSKIRANKRKMKELSRESEILKRSLAKLEDLIRAVDD